MKDKSIRRDITAVITGGEKAMLPARYEKVIELTYVEDVMLLNRKLEKAFRDVF